MLLWLGQPCFTAAAFQRRPPEKLRPASALQVNPSDANLKGSGSPSPVWSLGVNVALAVLEAGTWHIELGLTAEIWLRYV